MIRYDGGWREVVVLGLYQEGEYQRREHGYRVRQDNGAEFFLVREPLGRWYAAEFV
jgi:hypothetical protein